MISIIIPVYKVERQIEKCVDSILRQTYTDWELLLIDDGSPDKSGKICDEYARNDKRIRVIHKTNGGVSSARNVGLDVAKGKWIVFVDSDDWCEENYLLDFINVSEILDDNDIVLQGRKNEVNGKVVGTLSLREKTYGNVCEAMLENDLLTFGAPYCKLYSNRLIQKFGIRFPKGYSYGEDTTFFFKVLSLSKRIITTSKCNYHYVDAVVGSLSKKDHDYKQLKSFLKDSMLLVKKIDEGSCANGCLVASYTHNYINLILRSIVNMYRLGYSYAQKKACFYDIKKDLLPLIKSSQSLSVQVIRFVPTVILIILFNIIVDYRK